LTDKPLTINNDTASLKHIAIIMDGNNRWAKARGVTGVSGHKAGVERIRDVMRACREQGVEVLTLFAFSSENWQRPPREVEALMSLFYSYLSREAMKLKEEGVKLKVIGRRDRFSAKLVAAIEQAETIACEGETSLVIAADYGGRWDMVQAAKALAEQVVAGELSLEQIDECSLNAHTSLASLPEPDLLIRTGGDFRLSNYLLWQSSYSELYFTDTFWPDFDGAELNKAVMCFQQRQRRFGKTAEQLAT
jgi:undecaprenyl diphosphate synthase